MDQTTMDADPFTPVLQGHTYANDRLKLTYQADGTLVGTTGADGEFEIDGRWFVQDGKLCRSLKKPVKFAGTECQDAVIKGDTLTITSSRGTQVLQKLL